MARIDVGNPEYADWLAEIQRTGGMSRAVSRGMWRFALQWLLLQLALLVVAAIVLGIIGQQNGWF